MRENPIHGKDPFGKFLINLPESDKVLMQSSGSQVTYRIIYTNNVISHIFGRRSVYGTERDGRKSTDDDEDDDDVPDDTTNHKTTRAAARGLEEVKRVPFNVLSLLLSQPCNLIEPLFFTLRKIHMNNIFPCSLVRLCGIFVIELYIFGRRLTFNEI